MWFCVPGDPGGFLGPCCVADCLSGSQWDCWDGKLSAAGAWGRADTVRQIIPKLVFFYLSGAKCVCFSFFVPSCMFVSNLNGSSAPPILQPGQKSLDSALKADLVMNVFRDGQWGTFRHQLISHGIRLLKLASYK